MSNQFITTRMQWQLFRPFALRGIYLSGPISADPGTAPERFQKARDFIAEVFGPDQPIASPIGITLDNPDVPPSIVDPKRYTHPLYMIECYKFLMACNCIALLPGWHQSKGAIYEARFAESLGIAPLFLRPSTDGDGLLLDLGETFRALQRAEWVDFAIAEAEFGFVGDYVPYVGRAQELIPAGEDHYGNSAVNPVPVGGNPNPTGAPIDGAIAQAMEDASKLSQGDPWPAE